jgi:hypothetical protein
MKKILAGSYEIAVQRTWGLGQRRQKKNENEAFPPNFFRKKMPSCGNDNEHGSFFDKTVGSPTKKNATCPQIVDI